MAVSAAPILNHGASSYISGSERLAKDKARIEREIIVPILESKDLVTTFLEKWTAFKEWRNSIAKAHFSDARSAPGVLLQQEDTLDEELRRIFADAFERLGQVSVTPLLSGLQLRKIVRMSLLPHSDEWPECSWKGIAGRMTSNELCLVCILHHLATEAGQMSNVHTLAAWSFMYAQEAYFEAGDVAGELGLWHKLEREE